MEKNKIGSLLAGAGNAAKGTFDKVKEKTIHVVDQNDDEMSIFDLNSNEFKAKVKKA